MKCKKCDFEMKEGLNFCPKCGAKVDFDEESTVSQSDAVVNDSEAQPNDGSSVEGFVVSFAEKSCTGNSLKIASILAIVLQVIRVLESGDFLGFRGSLARFSYDLINTIPIWIVIMAQDLVMVFLILHLIDVFYSQGKKSQFLISLPVVWGIVICLVVAANFINMNMDDIRYIGYLAIAVIVYLFVVGYQLLKTKMSWLGKVIMAYSVINVVTNMSLGSTLMFLLSVASTIYLAIVFNKELSPYYEG